MYFTDANMPDKLRTESGIVYRPTRDHLLAAGWTEGEPPPPPDPLAPYADEIAAFQATWAGAGMATVPDDWGEAMQALESAGVDDRTLIRLLALRMALAPVWDAILEAQ